MHKNIRSINFFPILFLLLFLNLTPVHADSNVPVFEGFDAGTVISAYKDYLGTPYVWGGKGPSGWDCSGYVSYVASHRLNCKMPGSTATIYSYLSDRGHTCATGNSYLELSAQIASGIVRPADIILFINSSGRTFHIGIIGYNRTLIHAECEATGTVVTGLSGTVNLAYSYVVFRGVRSDGFMELSLESALPEITEENSLYSFEGCSFTVIDKATGKATGNLIFEDDSCTCRIELPEGSYQIKQDKTSPSYELSGESFDISINSGSTSSIDLPLVPVYVKGGPVIILKDRDSGLIPQGGGDFSKASFAVDYYPYYIDSNEELSSRALASLNIYTAEKYGDNSDLCCFKADFYESFVASGNFTFSPEGIPLLPLGTYVFSFGDIPEGYNEGCEITDSNSDTYGNCLILHVESDNGKGVIREGNSFYASYRVIRGDFNLTKTSAPSGELLGGITFTITSLTTGESHSFVTDDNGYFDSTLDPIYFGAVGEESSGSLPYDTYTIEEQASDANKGLTLFTGQINLRRDGFNISLNNVIGYPLGRFEEAITVTDMPVESEETTESNSNLPDDTGNIHDITESPESYPLGSNTDKASTLSQDISLKTEVNSIHTGDRIDRAFYHKVLIMSLIVILVSSFGIHIKKQEDTNFDSSLNKK